MPTLRAPALAWVGLAAAGLALAACSQPAARAAAQDADDRTDAGSNRATPARSPAARITGAILHPAHAVPAMRICALSDKTTGAAASDICIDTRTGNARYAIDGLRPGTYQIVARTADTARRVGGHVRPVQCVRAPCPEMLAEVTLGAGEHRAGVDLNGFYPERADFPAMP